MKATTEMEGGERAQSHRSGSEFFICFTARPSSSSTSCSAGMRVPSSKSLMSPGRGRDPLAPSLSASLSRRLRSSGSVKGGQSPMFPAGAAPATGGRRKGCGFEAAEPSSPKVTCIGQVRVKAKKKKNQSKGQALGRSRSQRRSGGEASFRRTSEQEKRASLPNRNQSWVHQLPLSICEALRSLGSELNCFVPCGGGRSPCSSSRTGEEKGGGGHRSRGSSSCGTVFTRWLMAIEEESEEGNRGELVGLVVEETAKGGVSFLVRENMKREVEYLGLEEAGNVERAEKKEEVPLPPAEEEVKEEGGVSVCIPPRNALLLMRCRSDPVKVAALADRFWGSPAAKSPCVEAAEEEREHFEEEVGEKFGEDPAELLSSETGEVETEETTTQKSLHGEISENHVAEEEVGSEEEERQDVFEEEGISESGFSADHSAKMQRNPPKDEGLEESSLEAIDLKEIDFVEREEEREEEEYMKGRRSSSCPSSKGKDEKRSNSCASSKAKEGGRRRSCPSKQKERRRHSFSLEREARRHSFSVEREARRASFSVDREGRRRWSFSLEKEELILKEKPMSPSAVAEAEDNSEETAIGAEVREANAIEAEKSKTTEETQITAAAVAEGSGGKEEEGDEGEGGKKEKRGEIPDCLLLMMYEPKLSMEVSKETWVCSTDFLRFPDHPGRYGHRPPSKAGAGGAGGVGGDDSSSNDKKAAAQDAQPSHPPPPPPPPLPRPPTASAVEPKLTSSAAALPPEAPPCGQFVLTRCKSEPVRSSARLAPDACFWKDRHRPIGVAGIGF